MEKQPSSLAERICANPHCRRRDIAARGRCPACYAFLYRNGRDAEPEEMGNRYRVEKPCQNCKERPIRARGRCYRCYRYWWRTGRERPLAHRIGPKSLCANCSRRPPYRKGRCRSCYAYLKLHQQDKPGV